MMLSYRYRPEVIEARLSAFERDPQLFAVGHLAARAVALDAIQQVYQFLQLFQRDTQWGRYRRSLTQQAKALERRLRQADADLFQTLRHQIRTGQQSAHTLRELFDRHTRYRPGRLAQVHRGYDALDALVQGLLRADTAPTPKDSRDIEMTPYEPTPSRVILDLADQTQLSADDVFYDLGSGLGHVTILVNLLTGAASHGIELEAKYCQHAQLCAEELGLSAVSFMNLDARQADYTGGTVFFMYTPFTGKVLESVLAALAREASRRPITICAYGACTAEVAKQSWICLPCPEVEQAYTLAVFHSR
jgi:hypothetical protein